MKIGSMLPALPHMDEAGFESMEFFLSVIFKKYVREHKENPWYWLKEGTKLIKKTRLRYHGGMHSAFEKTPHCHSQTAGRAVGFLWPDPDAHVELLERL